MAAKVKNENYCTIQGWMINELKLSGNELIAYAVIYGFSQADGQYMTCSQEYIGNWCNISREATNKLLKKMIDKGLIIKKLTRCRGAVKIYEYKAVRKASEESSRVTSAKTSHAASEESSHNIKRDIKKDIYKQTGRKKNSFLNFEQRQYSKEDYENMEKRLLQRK